jgi:hypothetical protein
MRAGSNHIPISQELLVLLAEELFHIILSQVTSLSELKEDILGNLSLLWGRGPSKVVKIDLEPVIDLAMDS